nr:hypothetical protein GZ27E7_39 [uncultured archaeon GZfos27E7]
MIITNSVVPVNRLSRSSLEVNKAFVCIFPAITIVRLALCVLLTIKQSFPYFFRFFSNHEITQD